MKQKTLFILWGSLFILCAGLGFIPEPTGAVRVLLFLPAAAFFAVGWLILYRADKAKDLHTLSLLRNLSAFSLGLTLLLLVANFLSVMASEMLGDLVYAMLVIVSSPMICSQYWAVSLFLWACLLLTAHSCLKKRKQG